MKMKSILFASLLLLASSSTFAAFPVKDNKTVTTSTQSNQGDSKLTTVNSSTSDINAAEDLSVSTTTKAVSNAEGKDANSKSWVIAVVLCFFLGYLGVHRFYLGYTGAGVLQLLTGGGFGIWWLIDFIRILVKDLKPKRGSYKD